MSDEFIRHKVVSVSEKPGSVEIVSIVDPRQAAQAYVENFVHDTTGKHIRLDRVSTAHVKALSEAIWKALHPATALPELPLCRHHDEEQIDDPGRT